MQKFFFVLRYLLLCLCCLIIRGDKFAINVFENCADSNAEYVYKYSIDHYQREEVEYPKNCEDIRQTGELKSGVRDIFPFKKDPKKRVSAYCDQTTEGGGWTVILDRKPSEKRENFERGWSDYEIGFGETCSEHWIGLSVMHELTNSSNCIELLMEMEDYDSKKSVVRYSTFKVGSADEGYVLTLDGFGPADFADSFSSSKGMKFSTKDRDQDIYDKNCAVEFRGGWWYSKCFGAKLTGFPYEGAHDSYADGINYKSISTYHNSFKKASMKIRPVYEC